MVCRHTYRLFFLADTKPDLMSKQAGLKLPILSPILPELWAVCASF